MPLKLRRTLSMEDLQNASDDEMDVLLSASEDIDSPRKCLKEAGSGSVARNGYISSTGGGGGSSQRERFFPFSFISDESSSAPPTQSHRARPRPNKNHVPVFVPVPDTDDFFLHGPQAPIIKIQDGGGGGHNNSMTSAVLNLVEMSGRINGISSKSTSNGIHHHHHQHNHHQHNHLESSNSCSPPLSKGVRFEELDEEEFCRRESGDQQRSTIHSQVNQVTQKMKDNIGRLLEREASLDSFADYSDQLHYSGDIYRQSTEHLRRKLWWRQQKTRFVLTALIIFFMLLLLVPLISRLFRGNWG